MACLAIYDVFLSPPIPLLSVAGGVGNDAAPPSNVTATTDGEFDDAGVGSGDAPAPLLAEYHEGGDLDTSMRCYRGPAMLALSMFLASYCLRVWRRNGVACDELIFLPDTAFESRLTGKSSHGGVPSSAASGEKTGGSLSRQSNSMRRNRQSARPEAVELVDLSESDSGSHCEVEDDADAAAGGIPKRPSRNRVQSLESLNEARATEGSAHQRRTLSPNPDCVVTTRGGSPPTSPGSSSSTRSRLFRHEEGSPISYIADRAKKGLGMLIVTERTPPLPFRDGSPGGDPSVGDGGLDDAEEYAPSAPSVLGAALDLSLPVLFNFHMFVVLMKDFYKKEFLRSQEGYVEKERNIFTPPDLPPKYLPMFYLTPLILRSQLPRRSRRRFYGAVFNALVPIRPVRFRDALVGDCITSLVRPLCDVVFTSVYYLAVLYGILKRVDIDDVGRMVSESSLIHGLVLPVVAILPLVTKIIQTLRQAYDTGRRWPYLGNMAKYCGAGWVVLYGITHAAGERSPWWTASFVVTTLYQTVWDVMMDWEMLVIVPRDSPLEDGPITSSFVPGWIVRCLGRLSNYSCVDSLNPRLFPSILLRYVVQPFRRRITHPVWNFCRLCRDKLSRVRLRPDRLFDDPSFYWKAMLLNASLRFCWMMNFIPAYRVSIRSGEVQETFVDKAHGWSFVILAALELARRCVWAIIKVELETIKLTAAGEGGGGADLTAAGSTDEYHRDGRWSAWDPAAEKAKHTPVSSPVRVRERDGRGDYARVEQGEQTLAVEGTQGTPLTAAADQPGWRQGGRRHRWLCFAVSPGFNHAAFVAELVAWPVGFVVASYYIMMIE